MSYDSRRGLREEYELGQYVLSPSISIGIKERRGIDLIDDGFFPPSFRHDGKSAAQEPSSYSYSYRMRNAMKTVVNNQISAF